ncbi:MULTISPECIES: transcription elongation factor GreA [Aerococcus]|uniref:Transcription elongation factor GreA n=5 Tax=Aerococcus TaxID=1375 RepID=A0A120I9S7_9LACT|nr:MULTISPECIES: transcription elongation factor GreA [Aerococcus]AMB95888.1 transcription elongation factor GreA [Aerococcus urinae]KAA9221139.1 transcription elongation factor GreA [Aerococcus loyolae]KAA9233573.1 transcription elongation factor GreA [Aerococcus mictus]KAA9240723.1 transcription elongation factor GreA [Aerococcus urinae]KAA9264619.1 transcription elongation factor GreA [Aerococcus loyolae]
MSEQTFPMTVEGKERLEAELEDLKLNKRPEVISRIKVARSFGDLSENSEYESAKNEQSILESQIAKIENMIRYAEIVDPDALGKDTVSIGKRVKFQELPDGEEEEYEIVGKAEADPLGGKISNESPIANALIGKKVGDEVEIETPGGAFSVRILAVETA